ncbi:MAG TPA: anthranilate phosphoribosyltransferase [Cytophagaceae bacterium]|nr:anthranilate phosphoribosyltransferase [Cytophagaceae bacterium]
MKQILSYLLEHKTLTKEEARTVLLRIGRGEVNQSQIAAFLAVYMMRSITVEELEGFRDSMLELCIPVDLKAFDPIDLCGTGGDGKDTFNISTCSSFVVAGAGINVAKHGNYGVSSLVGSSTIMEHFGYKFTSDIDVLQRQMENCGICFMHAPLFHPAMKNVGPIRKELGLKTFFNMLGPMINPAFPTKQMVGVFSLELARLYGYLYQKTNKDFMIVHSLDGYDEISLTSAFKMISNKREQLIAPDDIGFSKYEHEQLLGGATLEESAKIFTNVLENKSTEAQKQVVLANAGMGVWCARPQLTQEEAMATAKESLESGKAFSMFKKLVG